MNPTIIKMMSKSTVLTITFVLPLVIASFACSTNLLSNDGAAPLTTHDNKSVMTDYTTDSL